MKPVAVLDSSVVVSGIGWRGGEARAVLRLLALRGFVSARTSWLKAEWAETVERVAHEESRWRNKNWRAWLDWLNHASVFFEEIPIRVTVRRDPKDDPVVMAAVAARAHFIVVYDPDLLDLEKPYGIACVTPRAFLSRFVEAVSALQFSLRLPSPSDFGERGFIERALGEKQHPHLTAPAFPSR